MFTKGFADHQQSTCISLALWVETLNWNRAKNFGFGAALGPLKRRAQQRIVGPLDSAEREQLSALLSKLIAGHDNPALLLLPKKS